MIFWISTGILTLFVLATLVRSIRGSQVGAGQTDDSEARVYEDQMSELQRDIQEGRIAGDLAEAAQAEVARRMLQAGETAKIAGPKSALTGPLLAIGLPVTAVLAAFGLYLSIGSPGTPDFPLGQQPGAGVAALPGMDQHDGGEVSAAMAKLEARLKAAPDDLEGWMLLARSRAAIGDFANAATAFRKAVELSDGDLKLRGDFAETLVHAAGGRTSPEAVAQFEAVRAAQPGDPRARYFLAMARAQSGDPQGAIDEWMALAASAPAGASWLPDLRRQIGATAAEFGIAVPALANLPATPETSSPFIAASPEPGPDAADIAATQEMPAADQMTMIRGMVERLASRLETDPKDLDGWLRLIRAYRVLGEGEAASQAVKSALQHYPQDARLMAAAVEPQ